MERPRWKDHNEPGWRGKWKKWLSQYAGRDNVSLIPGEKLNTTPNQVDIQVTGKKVRTTLRRRGMFFPSDEKPNQ